MHSPYRSFCLVVHDTRGQSRSRGAPSCSPKSGKALPSASVFSLAAAARIKAVFAASLASLAIVSGTAAAQQYPAKPVRMIVPFGPGTTTDIVSRLVADGLSKTLGQPVNVENRAGAGGVIGTEAVAKSASDGYTLAMGTVGTHAINVGLFRKLPYSYCVTRVVLRLCDRSMGSAVLWRPARR
jgi:hypothetical protein